MKACASNKTIDSCSECHESAACQHVEILQKMRSGVLVAGLFVKTEEVDRQFYRDGGCLICDTVLFDLAFG